MYYVATSMYVPDVTICHGLTSRELKVCKYDIPTLRQDTWNSGTPSNYHLPSGGSEKYGVSNSLFSRLFHLRKMEGAAIATDRSVINSWPPDSIVWW